MSKFTAKGLLEKSQAVEKIQAQIDALTKERQKAQDEQGVYAREFFGVPENSAQAFFVENNDGAFAIEYDMTSPVLTRIKPLKK
jgi:phage baseplate assembly protein gpV